jgi:hypothetical protein
MHASSEIRTHDPSLWKAKTIYVLDRAAIMVAYITVYTKFNLNRFSLSDEKLPFLVYSPRNVTTAGHSCRAV